jgi:hypothetical protein
LTRFISIAIFAFFLLSPCTAQENELEVLKKRLFTRKADISLFPVYADPPTGDYSDLKKGIVHFQIDSSEIVKVNLYKDELEPLIIQRLDSSLSWVYLAAYLKYNSALPAIKDQLIHCEKFYGWEGGDYSQLQTHLKDEQYCYQMAYIAAIEYISQKPLSEAITLSDSEYSALKLIADQCNMNIKENLDKVCYAKWLLQKIKTL